jgi:ERCC4-type nuclease
MPEIIADHREKNSIVPKELQRLGFNIVWQNLPVGDYLVGEIPIERKTIYDYLKALEEKRLNNQLYELSYNAELSFLIVEGYVSEALMFRKMRRDAMISSLVGSVLKRAPDGKQGQVLLLQVETPYDTALAIKFIHDKLASGELMRLPEFKKITWNPNQELENIVASIPGIGPKYASILLSKFGTLRQLFSASEDELVGVMKEKRGKRLYEIFNRKYEAG